VEDVAAVHIPEQLSPAIARPRRHVEAVLAQSLYEVGPDGRAALAWQWALTGTRPSPVTLSLESGRPPSREEILAEAAAEPEGSTAPPGMPSNFCDQLRETRAILAWLAGGTDEIPVDDDNRGRLIGARGDYARTDDDIRQTLDHALLGLKAFDLPEPMSPSDAKHPWRWNPVWMNAAWLRGVRDILIWVLGETPTSPLCHRAVGLPTTHDLTYEQAVADDVVLQGRPGAHSVDPTAYPPPQYGEAIQATISWLRGEATESPTDHNGHSPYLADHQSSVSYEANGLS
jgi:hypothetical protein